MTPYDCRIRHDVLMKTVAQKPDIHGLMINTSTSDDTKGDFGRNYRDLCMDSHWHMRNYAEGTTSSGLLNLFIPAYVNMSLAMTDKYGMPIIGKLTKEEFSIVKTHTENGYNILRAADEYSNLAEYALSHHEYWDGSGYPRGLKGKEIPFYSRIIGIADAYEAMTSDRVYRKALSEKQAMEELIKGSGKQFDPELVKVFIEKVLKKEM